MSDESRFQPKDEVKRELTGSNFRTTVEEQPGPVLVLVRASGCHHCETQERILKELSKERVDGAKFYTLQADDERELLRALKVFGVPTLLFYKHATLVGKKVGVQSAGKITAILEKIQPWSPDEAYHHRHRSLLGKLLGKRDTLPSTG